MNLICPHCQQQVNIPDQQAGQTTQCPQCRGPFTVPMAPAPPPIPAVPPAAPAAPLGDAAPFGIRDEGGGPKVFDSAPPPPPPFTPAPQRPYEPTAPAVTGDYTKRTALYFSPKVIVWIAPICFFVIFLLLFFPWAGVYGGSQYMVRQSGVQLAFGGWSEAADNLWKEMSLDPETKFEDRKQELEKRPPSVWAPMVMLYFFLVILGVAAAIAFDILPRFMPTYQSLLSPWRSMVLGGLSIVSFLFLVIQLLFGFPLENRMADTFEKMYKKSAESRKSYYEKELEKAKDDREETKKLQKERAERAARAEFEYGAQYEALRYRSWLKFTLLLNLIAVIASLLDFYLARRAMKPLPRLVFER